MSSPTLNELGLATVCRSCLSDEGEMKSLFNISDNSELQILKIYETCTGLEISENDGLPGVICVQCDLRLNNAYDFRRLCLKSDKTLRQYVGNIAKFTVKDEERLEEKFEVEFDVPIKSNEVEIKLIEDTENIYSDRSDNEQNYDPDENSNDSDDKPLIARKVKPKSTQFDSSIVNQAIEDSKKKFHEQKECRLCGFVATNSRGLSLHIAHLHKELRDRWCNVCYEEVDDLQTHSKEHVKLRTYACTFCEKSFSSQGHLTEHLRTHAVERPFKCDICAKGFLSARHLKVHNRIHSGEKPFSCPYCTRRFTQKGSLQGHIRTHTGSKPFQCDICEKRCTTSSALALHRTKTGHANFSKIYIKEDLPLPEFDAPIDENTIVVAFKSDQNSTDSELNPTTSTSIEKEVDKKLCTVCGKTFSTASKLRLHMRVHTGETPYKCQFCSKKFTTRGQLVVHVRTHTGEKPHVCHVCGKGFAQSSVLNTHMKLHTGRPEQCQVCQQRFCRPAELRLHMRKHTGEKPYLCTVCGHSFIQRSHLMEHVKIHSDERPYKCHLCERAFKQSSSLKSHIQIHTGYKPYKCSQCPYACRQPYSLTQHMKQHSTDQPQPDRPHICLVCNKSFTTLAMLTSHSRTVHQAIF